MNGTFNKLHPIFIVIFFTIVCLGFTAFTTGWRTGQPQSNSDSVKQNPAIPSEKLKSALNSLLINSSPVFPVNSKTQIDSKPQPSNELEKQQLKSEYMQLPIRFEPNRGQIDSSKVKFTAHGSGYSLFLTNSGATFVLRQLNRESLQTSAESNKQPQPLKIEKQATINMRLLEADNLEKTEATEELKAKSNYFIGNNPAKWQTDVPNYGRVRFQEAYEGIDLEYYGNQKEIEYDFIVKAGADPEKIRLQFDGVEEVSVNEQGELVLKTEIGEIRQKKPFIYQEENGERQEIAGGYKVKGDEVAFWLGQYDKQKTVIIDPILYTAAFIGGSDFDSAQDISSFNYSYTTSSINYNVKGYTLTGITSSLNFPITSGAEQTTYGGGTDAFVRTFSQKFQEGVLIENDSYTTYLGGSGYDAGYGAAIDIDRDVWITGETASANFPLTPNAPQRTYGGGVGDAYIVRLNPHGNSLLYSTFHGGSGYDYGFDIGIQNELTFDGYPVTTGVWLTGGTSSTNFPTISPSAAQPTYGGGTQDAFVTKISVQNTSLTFNANAATLGAIPDSAVTGPQVPGTPRDVTFTVSGAGNISNIEVTMALTHSFIGDVKAVLIAPNGTSHNLFGYTGAVSSTSFGDDSDLNNYYTFKDGAASPPSGGWWQEATTQMATQALSSGDYRTTNSGGPGATNPMPATSMNSTFSGLTNANGTWILRITDGAAQDTGSITDAFLTFNTDYTVNSTFLGGTGNDVGKALSVDHYNFSSYVWITGSTSSTNFPTTTGAFQRTYGGGTSDAFVSRFYLSESGPYTLNRSTYLGGTGTDSGNGISFWYVTGNTSSTNFPTTTGAFQRTYGGGTSDAFYSSINYDFQSIYASTFLGGSGDDVANDITEIGNDTFITGSTTSTNFPITSDAVQSVKSGGKDVFISKINFGTLRYSTYYGGSNDDSGNSIAAGIAALSDDNTLVVGDTSSTNFPTTQGAGQTVYGGGSSDGFFINTYRATINIHVNVVPGCYNPTCSNSVNPTRIYATRNRDSQQFDAVGGIITVTSDENYFVTAEGGGLFDGRNVNWTGYSLNNVNTDQSLSFYVQTPSHNVIGKLVGLTSPTGVTVNVTGGNIVGTRTVNATLNTQNEVIYSIIGLSCSYRYTVTPQRNGTTFSSPSNGQTPVIFQDETLDFTAQTSNPTPAIGSISPTSVTAGAAAFPLTVIGSNFVSNSVVRWNGQDRTTTFVSATQLTAQITTADIQTAGTFPVTVFNPTPGGGTSATSVPFTVNNPTPAITTLNPTTATVGGSAFELTVNGSNFVSGSIVKWNGQNRTTTFVSATQVKAQITAADIQTAGTFPITVFNTTPGGGTSNAVNFTVNNIVPSITTLSPTNQTVGTTAFELTVNGTGFINGSVVRWNGQNRTTTFVSITQVKAQITATDVQTAGTFPVTVFNPAPGGGTSAAVNFTVNNPVPTITMMSPTNQLIGAGAFELTVNGSNFVNGSIIKWNGQNRTTTFVSATQLKAQIPATDSQTLGTFPITVFNATPGGGTSNAINFMINNPRPAITTLSPSGQTAGSAAFELTVNGSSFLTGSIVQWNGQNRTTTFVSATQVKAQITAADVQTAGTFPVTVTNPAPGGGASNSVNFTVSNGSISITVQTNPAGLSIIVDGVTYTSPPPFSWVSGSSHTISCAATQNGTTGTRYAWNSWGDGNTQNPRTISPTAATTYTANYATQYQLTVNASPANGGTITPTSGNWYNAGQQVQAMATPNGGFRFDNWTGAYSGTNNPATITMNGPVTETANFSAVTTTRRAPFDFDGDNKTDIGIFRPSDGNWWYSRSSDGGVRVYTFGTATDILTPGDFTGDGKADIAIWRPSTGFWFVQRSEDNSFYSFPFGANGDIPAPADYDGDGKTDAAVFRPASGTWFILNSGGSGVTIITFGTSQDKPVPADFDGDGKADIAIFRPGDGTWWYLQSSDQSSRVYRFGASTDKTVQGDYTGDGKADIAVFRPSTGEWLIQRSEDTSFYSVPFGANGDIPAPGDYDGDGKFDTAVFRPNGATWFINRSTAGILIAGFGVPTDVPIPSAYVR